MVAAFYRTAEMPSKVGKARQKVSTVRRGGNIEAGSKEAGQR
jgi:hypothetical protein